MSRRVVPGSPVSRGSGQLMLGGLELPAPTTDAVFSPDLRYRYRLKRVWDAARPLVLWVMLNPSAADALAVDPTVTRCIGFAKSWGYGGIMVGNAFALRATDPELLYVDADPIGPENDEHLREMAGHADRVVVAWGNPGAHLDRGARVLELLRGAAIQPKAFGFTNSGQPKHPLYLPADAELVEVP